jgi:hypothetical protein
MPSYLNDAVNWTLAANTAARYWVGWPPGQHPNKGPILFAADPPTGQPAEVDLITYDVAKCRNSKTPGPSDVVYKFSVNNASSIAVTFNLEMILFNDLLPGGGQ